MNIFAFIAIIITMATALDWSQVQNVVNDGIRSGILSGCVLSVANKSNTLYKKAFGTTGPRRDLSITPVQIDDKFDINSLTQVIAVGSIFMRFYDSQRINITDRVTKHLIDFDNNAKRPITIQNVMMHNSGMYSDYPGNLPANQTEFLKQVDNSKLVYKTQDKFAYSQLGFVVLGQVVRKLSANQALSSAIYQILIQSGLRDTGFNPNTNTWKIVPGGILNGVAQGRTFNPYAALMKGQGGNAGLFSTAADMVTYMQLMLNKGKPVLGSRIFSEQVIDLFTTPAVYKTYKNTRACGWDTLPEVNPPCGKKFSVHSFGLSDVSGSYIWGDKDKGIAIVFLANGNFPAPHPGLAEFQGRLSDAIMTVLGY